MTIARYWSQAVILKNMHVPIVVPTSEVWLVMNRRKVWVTFFKKPQASITPPNVRAAIISHTVFSMPAIPFVVRRLSTSVTPVVNVTPWNTDWVNNWYLFSNPSAVISWFSSSPWNRRAKSMPNVVPQIIAGMGGTFLMMMMIKARGTISRKGEMWKVWAIPSLINSVLTVVLSLQWKRPMTAKITRVRIIVGPVV